MNYLTIVSLLLVMTSARYIDGGDTALDHCDENSDCDVLITEAHPDVVCGRLHGTVKGATLDAQTCVSVQECDTI